MGSVAYRFEPYEEVMCVNIKTNEKMFFETLKEASEKTGVCYSTIQNRIKDGKASHDFVFDWI